MAVSLSRPSGRRADDVRALRFRFRTLTFSGNYATGGDTILASDVGLKRILYVTAQNPMIATAAGTQGTLPMFEVASDGRSVKVRQVEDAALAAGNSFGAEKTNAEAILGGSVLNVLFVGE